MCSNPCSRLLLLLCTPLPAVALMAGQREGLSLWSLEDVGDNWRQADAAAIAPVVAIPTTAGTGSEVGRAGVILNEETHQKKIIFHPRMLPLVVISDPELTTGLPRGVTAVKRCMPARARARGHGWSAVVRTTGRARRTRVRDGASGTRAMQSASRRWHGVRP